jgi:ribosomal-protein-alanine N-acetyltransferase
MSIQIETPRLYIREILPSDAEGMFRMDSDKEVHRYLGNNPVTDIQQTREVIAFVRSQYEQYGIGRWAVIKKDTDEFIGWTGFKFYDTPINKHTDFYDFGYRFASAFWRQGYATESGMAALKYGIDVLGFRKIYGMTAPDNIGSRKTLEKLGFHYVETFNYDAVPSLWENDPTTWYKLGETQPDM